MKKKAEVKTALGEIEFWRSRSATYNTLDQQLQLPEVRKIIQVRARI